MNKRSFIKTLIGLTLIPLISIAEINAQNTEEINQKITSSFIESNSWIVMPEDIIPIEKSSSPSHSFFQEIKKTYHSLKHRYKAAKRSFIDPQASGLEK